jgi:glycerate kinase
MARGWKKIFKNDELVLLPMADGGDGTLEAFHDSMGGVYVDVLVEDPYGYQIQSQWLKIEELAVIEMAKASGLSLVKEEQPKNILMATSFGTGQLIQSALDAGCRRIYIGIGGSATNDGGMGMMRALGARFLSGNDEIKYPKDLIYLNRIDFSDFDSRIPQSEITVACDVKNPLYGPIGATAVFGKQKGATADNIEFMDRCLKRLAETAAQYFQTDMGSSAGAGAAGGVGWALMQCFGANMRSGIDMMLDVTNFDVMIKTADLVITGEGCLDAQSSMGKVPFGIAQRASEQNVPVAAIAGTLGEGYEILHSQGITCAIGITAKPMTLQEAMEGAEELIESAAERLARSVFLGQMMHNAARSNNK